MTRNILTNFPLACSWLLACLVSFGLSATSLADQSDTWHVGLARVDVTPDYPIRLHGFGSRRTESEGVTQRIWAKAIAIGRDDQSPAILITLDNLGVRMTMVDEVAARLQRKAGIRRDRIVLCFSHSHTTPKVNGSADNIFSQPIPPEHQQHIDRYTLELTDKLEAVALAALEQRQPSRLAWSVGKVAFAKNRRTPGGPVDHDLPLLAIKDLKDQVRGVYVGYACHCVTLSHNQISGDWAGYAQELIERKFPGAIALVSIGAGSDSNPDSGVTGDKVDVATSQGAQIADEVARLLQQPLRPLTGELNTQLQIIPLPLNEPPTREQLQQLATRGGPAGYNAQTQLARLDRGERLLDSIAYPVQTWSFGDRLSMVFLAGEVCVDYSIRLKTELDRGRLWVTGYSNDFCAYIPSERLLREGGYGGGGEIPYFALPSTFQPGLEQKIVDEVRRQLPSLIVPPGTQGVLPKSPADSLQSLHVHDSLRIELVASEPALDDPVAVDFGPDGRLWVAEMPDYTRGTEETFEQHGRVKFLEDRDGDGQFETATVFMDGLRFPTDVKVWRDGVLVCDAPDILWAQDADGDGRADEVRKLFTGFATHNPHARVNSLRLGLDNWLYGSGGLFGGQITNLQGKTVDVTGRDFRLNPDTGAIEPVTGRTQQGRVRDDWDNWFGCDNGTLIRHYPLSDRYLRRNPHVAPPTTAVYVPDYPEAGKLFPLGELVRFKLSGPPGRPTSACGLEIYRDELLGPEFAGNSFVCEPVNQLVHRLVLSPRGVSFSGRRAEEETEREFLASTDSWFRPVQVRTGPDGAIWVVDMYRYVIEHPRWIPPETVASLNTLAGSGLGRIYRIVPRDKAPRPVPRLDQLPIAELTRQLDQPNGTLRDLVQQLIVWQADPAAVAPLRQLARDAQHPAGRLQALATLEGLEALEPHDVQHALQDAHPGVRRHAIRLSEQWLDEVPEIRAAVLALSDDADAGLRLQLAYSLGESRDPACAVKLAAVLLQGRDDPYLVAAAVSSLRPENVATVLREVMARSDVQAPQALLDNLLVSATRLSDVAARKKLLDAILTTGAGDNTADKNPDNQRRQVQVVVQVLQALRDQDVGSMLTPAAREGLQDIVKKATVSARDSDGDPARRLQAIELLTRAPGDAWQTLVDLLAPQHPLAIQQAAAAGLGEREDSLDALLAAWNSASPALRGHILDALLGRRAGIDRILAAVESGTMRASDIDPARRSRLEQQSDAAQRKRAAGVLQSTGSTDRVAVLKQFEAVASLPGDAAAGRAVFAKVCANCHKLDGQGHAVGPDLAALTSRSAQALLLATLDPSRDVDARYQNYLAVLSDGRVVSGMLSEETATSLTLVEQAGKQHVILRNELDDLRATGKSLMPDGLEKDLAPQDLANVLAYVASAGPRPKTLAGNQPAVVMPDASNQLLLRASQAEIYGGAIVFEPPLGNIGYWHGQQDHVRWRVHATREIKMDVYLDWACANDSAGNTYQIDGLSVALQGVVAGTGGWDKYQQAKIGSVMLPAGESHVVVRPAGPLTRPALFDLRGVYLVPAGEKLSLPPSR